MKSNRRTFIKSAAILGGLGTARISRAAATDRSNPTTAAGLGRDTAQWQRHVDTGFYPAQTHLLLDDFYVKEPRGLKVQPNPPRDLTPERPLLRAERDWEGAGFPHRCTPLLYDHTEKLFKFWCPCEDHRIPPGPAKVQRRWAYAISRDGVNWERPNLGLVEFAGSKANNIIRFENIDKATALLQNVVRDDREPDPRRRFKSIGLDRHDVRPGEITWTGPGGPDKEDEEFLSKIGCGLFVGYSPDGLRWTLKEGWCASGALIADGSVLHGFDPRINKWVMWQRPRLMPKYRSYGMSVSDDFENWTFPVDALAADELDPPGMQIDSLVTAQAPDGGYVGLAAFNGYEGKGFSPIGNLPQLVFSRDGRQWTRVDRQPYMVSTPGSWNWASMTPLTPVVVGDEMFLYYYGKNGKYWGDPLPDGKGVVTAALGLAKLPRDRWASRMPVYQSGEFTTRLVTFMRPELQVNIDARGGACRVELLEYQSRKAIPGYTLADCDPITDDALARQVSWKGRSDLTEVIGSARRQPRFGRALMIRFHLEHGARLYSFSC